ncbi:putative DNA helicase ino80 [Mycoemilia scoparia]|uniref:Chromatin-remodeling ATPase INO80 n=1 Tax=Mycoemilia scoparia TaxID=417184 RepID=A0A9W8DSX7_9FUNG|nr:putative DNA helicase ino80 [Mycoemilia scoparia]
MSYDGHSHNHHPSKNLHRILSPSQEGEELIRPHGLQHSYMDEHPHYSSHDHRADYPERPPQPSSASPNLNYSQQRHSSHGYSESYAPPYGTSLRATDNHEATRSPRAYAHTGYGDRSNSNNILPGIQSSSDYHGRYDHQLEHQRAGYQQYTSTTPSAYEQDGQHPGYREREPVYGRFSPPSVKHSRHHQSNHNEYDHHYGVYGSDYGYRQDHGETARSVAGSSSDVRHQGSRYMHQESSYGYGQSYYDREQRSSQADIPGYSNHSGYEHPHYRQQRLSPPAPSVTLPKITATHSPYPGHESGESQNRWGYSVDHRESPIRSTSGHSYNLDTHLSLQRNRRAESHEYISQEPHHSTIPTRDSRYYDADRRIGSPYGAARDSSMYAYRSYSPTRQRDYSPQPGTSTSKRPGFGVSSLLENDTRSHYMSESNELPPLRPPGAEEQRAPVMNISQLLSSHPRSEHASHPDYDRPVYQPPDDVHIERSPYPQLPPPSVLASQADMNIDSEPNHQRLSTGSPKAVYSESALYSHGRSSIIPPHSVEHSEEQQRPRYTPPPKKTSSVPQEPVRTFEEPNGSVDDSDDEPLITHASSRVNISTVARDSVDSPRSAHSVTKRRGRHADRSTPRTSNKRKQTKSKKQSGNKDIYSQDVSYDNEFDSDARNASRNHRKHKAPTAQNDQSLTYNNGSSPPAVVPEHTEFPPEFEQELLDYMLHIHRRARSAISRYEEYYNHKKRRVHKNFLKRYQDRLQPHLSKFGSKLTEWTGDDKPLVGKSDRKEYKSTGLTKADMVSVRGKMSLKALEYPPITPTNFEESVAGYDDADSFLRSGMADQGSPKPTSRYTSKRRVSTDTPQQPPPPPPTIIQLPPAPLTEEEIKQRKADIQKSIFRQIACNYIPKAYQQMQSNVPVRNNNARKVAQLCQRELRRASGRSGGRATTKPPKELVNKARRTMREMLVFWKRHEREEREARKRAEKEAAEKQRQEEEAREARRQQRKLNFLISQTELYSHFIAEKKADGSEDASKQDEENTKDFNDLDFDSDKEDELAQQARASARNALAQHQDRIRKFDNQVREDQKGEGQVNVSDMVDSMNLQNPTTMDSSNEVKQPNMLMCQLKEYQLKGLNWLANLYEQGINGILADEMGLGKTVQSISLLAYLAETHNIYGPFMVVAPASTLHNWQQEITRFVPEFKVLPYWGTQKDRKVLRRSFWNTSQLGRKDSPFHVVITSYQIVVSDESCLNRVKWQYMVLDEAQAIKSSTSTRWKVLLRYHCRNRLLLTGTPIQNSMHELWALLHFIMPSLFDSHEEFGDWFSRDIEAHAENRSTLNEHQLRRLQMILKPFMLRRIKRHVQHELADKVEHLVPCELTQRQTVMYRGLLGKISVTELLSRLQSGSSSSKDLSTNSDESLMNLVMQFRKVCNHPELFERAEVESPFAWCVYPEIRSISRDDDIPQYHYATRNILSMKVPRLFYREGIVPSIRSHRRTISNHGSIINRLFSIWSTENIVARESDKSSRDMVVLKLLGYTPKQIQDAHFNTSVDTFKLLQETTIPNLGFWQYAYDHPEDRELHSTAAWNSRMLISPLNTSPFSLNNLSLSPNLREMATVSVEEFNSSPCSLLPALFKPAAVAPPIDLVCSDHSFALEQSEFLLSHPVRHRISPTIIASQTTEKTVSFSEVLDSIDVRRRDWSRPFLSQGSSYIWVPSMEKLIRNSGKMAVLDQLLTKLKAEGHRVLIYFQMTRMIDLMEEYLAYRQHSYLRLDGSSKISDRRDMVTDWQTRPDLFVFLLSTRAGGLGINLTAADTVIFYDSDWNPTVDQQAMDRAHRLGQTKQVVVYRLITKRTIEERILQRAKQKDQIHKIVIAGSDPKTSTTNPNKLMSGSDDQDPNSLSDEGFTNNTMDVSSKEIVSLLLDETSTEEDQTWTKSLVTSRTQSIEGQQPTPTSAANGKNAIQAPSIQNQVKQSIVGSADHIFADYQRKLDQLAAAARAAGSSRTKRKSRGVKDGRSKAETPTKKPRTSRTKKSTGTAANSTMSSTAPTPSTTLSATNTNPSTPKPT